MVLSLVAGSRETLKNELKKLQKNLRNAKKGENAALIKKLLKQLKAIKVDLRAL
jgi:hypothetical protein